MRTTPPEVPAIPAEAGFEYESPPARVVFADGAVARLGAELRRLGARRAVVFASERHRGTVESSLAGQEGLSAEQFAEVRRHVPAELAARAGAFADEREAEAVVAVGGGSAIGLAKAVAREREAVLAAVPTTYSGSEMTPVWAVTTAGRKETGTDLAALADVVLYDPDLTRSLPSEVAAASGLNAVAHCVEALYAPRANPVTALAALDGLRRLGQALPSVVGDDAPPVEAVRACLHGAFLGGLAMGQVGVSFHHKTCHVLGGRYDLPHAETHAALLPHSARLAAEVFPDEMAPVAPALGAADPGAGVAALAAAVGAPASLAELGMPADDVGYAADEVATALERAGIPLSRARIGALLQEALGG